MTFWMSSSTPSLPHTCGGEGRGEEVRPSVPLSPSLSPRCGGGGPHCASSAQRAHILGASAACGGFDRNLPSALIALTLRSLYGESRYHRHGLRGVDRRYLRGAFQSFATGADRPD